MRNYNLQLLNARVKKLETIISVEDSVDLMRDDLRLYQIISKKVLNKMLDGNFDLQDLKTDKNHYNSVQSRFRSEIESTTEYCDTEKARIKSEIYQLLASL